MTSRSGLWPLGSVIQLRRDIAQLTNFKISEANEIEFDNLYYTINDGEEDPCRVPNLDTALYFQYSDAIDEFKKTYLQGVPTAQTKRTPVLLRANRGYSCSVLASQVIGLAHLCIGEDLGTRFVCLSCITRDMCGVIEDTAFLSSPGESYNQHWL
uniref:Uncharacterized protein n=1 Tax=Amphimedon queenslandica TaxID=400682 RepID=A0A1X7V9B6_AMPQE